MYLIKCDDKTIFDTRIDELRLLEPKFNLETNTVDEGSFIIYDTHPNYDDLKPLKSSFEVSDTNGVVFRGRMTLNTKDFHNGKTVDLEGAMAYFNDSIVRPFKYPEDFAGNAAYNNSANKTEHFLGWLIENHNSQVQDFQKFKLGRVTVKDQNNYISRSDEDYKSTWQILSEKLFESSLGGYLCIRYEEDGNYIDYLADFDEYNSQGIIFGENLLNLLHETDATETFSAMIPIGATLTDEEGVSRKVTIEGVADGQVDTGIFKSGDTIYSQEAVEKYGWIYAPIDMSTWDDVTTASALLSKSKEFLKGTGIMLTDRLELTAVDLNLTDDEIESLRTDKKVRVVSKPHGIGAYYKLTRLEIDLLNPENTVITIGETRKTLTEDIKNNKDGVDGTDGKDALSLTITTDNGTVFKDGGSNTTLTAHLYSGGSELSIDKYGSIKWYKENAVLVSGNALKVESSAVLNKAVYTAVFCDLNGIAIASAEVTLSQMIDVTGNYRFYYLKSTSGVPSKPTAYPPGGSWSQTEPSYTPGSTANLYVVDCSTYSNGTFYYSPVSLSTSYEAAKAAYKKAQDALTSAENAKKVATNYIDYDGEFGEGLVIGNLTESVLGRNVYIDKDSVDIRDNKNVLATFAENLIELGKGNTSSTIEMCGGAAKIRQVTEDGTTRLKIEAPQQLYLSSDKSARMVSKRTVGNLQGTGNLYADAWGADGDTARGQFQLYGQTYDASVDKKDVAMVSGEYGYVWLTGVRRIDETAEAEVLINYNPNVIDMYGNVAISKALEVTGKGNFKGGGVEIFGATPYIDFHFGNNTADYTARIIEYEKGKLSTKNLRITGSLTKNADEVYSAKILYDTSGNSGSIILSESAANFTFLEIIVGWEDMASNSIKVNKPNGRTFDAGGVLSGFSGNAAFASIGRTRLTISGDTITQSYNGMTTASAGGWSHTASKMFIKTVIGYR